MKFVMTGHKGLIGTSLLQKLKERGDTPVLLVDKREGKNILNMDDYAPTEQADVMIHLASFCKINKTIEDPQLPFENNVLGTQKVLDFCRKHKIKKIIFTSSSRVLSKEKNPYTASKLFGEELVKGYCHCYDMDYVIIRPSTVYGPFNDETKRLMDIFILNALNGKELRIFGDENKTLDFTYVDDFVNATLLAMEQKNKEYDISEGKGTKVSEVADLIINLAGKGTKSFYPAEIAQPQEVQLDISTIKSIGYTPKFSVEEGVKKTFDWYKEHFEELNQR